MLARLRSTLGNLPRSQKRLILVAFDAAGLGLVLWISYHLRLGPAFQPTPMQLSLMALAPALAIPVFVRFGLYRAVIRYLPERAIWTIVQAMFVATLLWVFALFLAEVTRISVLPRTVPLFYFLAGTAVIVGSRFVAKLVLLDPRHAGFKEGEVAIYGAGQAGTQLAAALMAQGSRYVAAFLDDDTSLHGRDVSGIRVYPPSRLDGLIRDHGVREVILSMPSIDADRRAKILDELSRHPVAIRTLPGISEIASGKYVVSQLREIDIDDLLGRSSVPADPTLFEPMLRGRTILVSGAGGSIGSELCRIVAGWSPGKLVLLEANEFALYEIDRALRRDPDIAIVSVLGSVTDERLVRRVLADEGVEVVFHAAAHKHVPLLEANAIEAVRNNVLGTATIVEAALDSGVADFVLISTDKAVRPSNVMGATKRWAELIVHDAALRAAAAGRGQRFSAVRFGNVLGSNGSVVPLFREQIAAGGPVTLTDERMTRYFMSIHEAAELIVQAGALSAGGETFLLEMGEPVRIRDLAENMIRLAGFSVRSPQNPRGDIAIEVTGARPGEKLYEELFYDSTRAERTRQPKIFRSQSGEDADVEVEPALAALRRALEREDEPALREVLFGVIQDAPTRTAAD